jgi:F-type H+-transporting ATPase subunit delta
MQETTVARSYAEALLELALADGALEVYAEEVRLIADLMRRDADFRLFMETPRIPPAEKKRVVRRVFEGKLPTRLLRFLLVLIDKRRARLLPVIADEFSNLVDERHGRLKVEVTLASEADRAAKGALRERLSRVLGKDVLPRFSVNPRIIGGVVVRVGDRVLDGSVRHRLQELRRSLLKAQVG